MNKKIHIITYIALTLPLFGWGQEAPNRDEDGDGDRGYTYYDKVIKQGAIPKPSLLNPMLPRPNTNYNTYIARDTIRLLPGFNSANVKEKPFIARIDESLIYPVDYQDPINPDERDLDFTKPVGAIAGVVDVSPTGAATYQIPIFTPPGTAGMQPQISIVYNSQGGNGLLGMGWDIAGLSAITVTPQSIYHDGFASEVSLMIKKVGNTFQMQDRLALDGKRMIMLPNTGDYYCHPNSIFTTEDESFLRITPKDYTLFPGNLPFRPTWFELKDKNGRTLEYGKSGNSTITPNGMPGSLYAWKLNKVSDINDNYMKYIYKKGDGVSWIDTIEYTGNSVTGTPTYNIITFLYATRSDQQLQYIGGFGTLKSAVLLRGIKVESEGKVVRRYWFNYHKDFYSHLVEIIEEGSDGKSLNSTIVQWGQASIEPTLTYFSSCYNTNSEEIVATADFNRDGREDIVVVNQTDKKWKVFVSTDSGFVKKYESKSYGNNTPEWIMVHTSPPSHISSAPCIYVEERWPDGNNCSPRPGQKCVIHKISRHSLITHDSNYNELNTYILLDHSQKQWEYDFVDRSDNVVENGKLKYPPAFQAFDCRGDGIISFMTIEPYKGWRCSDIGATCIEKGDNFVFADFTGAGKQSLLTIKSIDNDRKINVKSFVYDENENWDLNSANPNQSFSGQKIMLGDFNGDGKADLFISDDKEEKHYVAFSNGMGFEQAIEIEEFNGKSSNFIHIGDINGDGKDDIIFALTMSSITIAYAKGDGTFDYKTLDHSGISDSRLIDYYGTGKKVLLSGFLNYIYLTCFHSETIGERQHSVKSIKTGVNESISFEYLPLTKGGEFHKGELHILQYPAVHIQPPLYAVSKLIREDGIGGHSISEFSYQGAKIHRLGKGFLGFSSITMKNSALNIKTVSGYNFDKNYFTTYLDTIRTYILLPEEKINETVINQKAKNLGDKRYFPYIDNTSTEEFIKRKKTVTKFEYDNAGNITKRETDYRNGFGSSFTTVFTETNKYKYAQYGNWGVDNCLISDTTITKHADDTKSYTRTTSYEYDNKGNLNKIKTDVGVTTSYNINSYGLAHKKTTSAPGEPSYIEDFGYDDKQRFIETISVSGLGSSSKKYSPTGNLLYEIDITGLKTSYKYDGFGRVTGIKTPEGPIITTNYGWHIDDSTKSLTYVETKAPGRPKTKTYFDIFGREVRSETDGFFNYSQTKKVITDKKYNAKGQLWKTSFPYFDKGTPQWTVNEYDEYGRIVKDSVKLATTLVTNYVYSKLNNSITITRPDNTTLIKVFNVCGDIVSINDHGGSVTYKYHSSRQPREISAGGGTAKMTYDKFGRQDTLKDPNAGTITYTYNALGQLKTQKDARGKTTTNNYDNWRRIQTIVVPGELTKTYTYNDSGSGKGQIKSITSSQSELHYEYSDFGRLTKMTEKIVGDQSFVTQYEYDKYGNTSKITYPSGFSVRRTYNDAGYLIAIRRGDTDALIWQRDTENALGQPLTYKMGNGKTTTLGYDGNHQITGSLTPGVQNFSYSIEPKNGNMKWRKDNTQNLQENFYYDKLHRLDSVMRGSTKALSMRYALDGNIRAKSDASSYPADNAFQYLSPKPHALTNVYGSTEALQQSGNEEITYTSFLKADTITNFKANQRLIIAYGVDNQRMRTRFYDDNTLQKTKYFAASYEREVTPKTTREINYISTPYGVLAAYISSNGNGQMHYLYKDHLGSITHITNQSGAVVESRSFDAWGRMRRPDTWSYTNVTPMSILDRGYTGHEHLPQFGLINMNGRMYDPLVGRMLSPDPYVHGIAGTQGFNRYSYALNNPLKFTDPSGEHPILAAALLGPVIAGFSVGITDMATGSMTSGGQFLGHLAVGAAAGAAGAAIGAGAVGVLEGAVYGAASGAASGFIGGAGSAWVRGASASEIFRQGLRGAAWGAATGAVAGGVGGGIKAKRMGLDPMTGKGIGKPTYSAMPETATTTSGVRERSKYTIFGETNMDLDITEDTYLQFPGSKEYVQNATIGEGMLKGKVELKGYRLVNSSGETIGGACAPYKSSAFGNVKGAISISPMMAMYADDLLAVLGHEVIHAYQFSQGFTQLFNEGIMEYYAHRFSASIPHSLQTGSKMMMQYYQPYFSPVRSLHDFYPPWAIPFVR